MIVQVGGDLTLTATARLEEVFEDDPVGVCPYPGLLPFEPGQDKWYFGRGRDVAALLERIDKARIEGGPVLLIGASGAGKSSLLRCGLISAIARNGYGAAGSRDWPRRVITPGPAPARELADVLAAMSEIPAERILDLGARDPAELSKSMCMQLTHRRLLIVVDQFEEVFTSADEESRARFIGLLKAVCSGAGSPVGVVLGLRADFYGHCLSDPWLRAALRDDPVQLGPVERSDLDRVILGPADQVGLTVQPELREALLADMGVGSASADASSRLPLLAHALRATWLKRSGRTLTLAGYHDTGGIHGAIAATADRLYAKLGEPAQAATRAVFLRLVRIGGETLEDARRHLTRDELASGFPDVDAVAEVVAAYTNQRLLTQEQGGLTITHEALLQAWPRLRSWMDADRASHVFRQELEAQVRTWQDSGHDSSVLQRGSRLDNAEQWAQHHPGDVARPVERFLVASRAAESRRRRQRRYLTAILAALTLVASATAGLAVVQQRRAVTQQRLAEARAVAQQAKNLLPSQPGLAMQLAVAAYQLDHDSGRGALIGAMGSPGTYDAADPVIDFAQDRAGSLLALSTGTAIVLWSAEGHSLGRVEGVSTGPIALSADGRLLAVGVDGDVQLWDTTDPKHAVRLITLPANGSDVTAVAVSADKKRLAVGTSAGAILTWDTTIPAQPRELRTLAGHPGGTDSVTFPVAGPSVLASAGADHFIRIWQLGGGEPYLVSATIREFAGGKSQFGSSFSKVGHRIAFSSNGKNLIAPGDDGGLSLRIWKVDDPSKPALLTHSDATNNCGIDTFQSISLSNSPGTTIATACSGGIQLWKFEDNDELTDWGHLTARGDDGGALAFQPATKRLLVATRGGIHKYDVQNPTHVGALATFGFRHTGLTVGMALSSGGRQLLAVAGSDSGELWQVNDSEKVTTTLLARLPGSSSFAGKSAAFSPDGNRVAISEDAPHAVGEIHPVVRLRDTTNPGVPVIFTIDNEIDNSAVYMQFSPDGRILALVDDNYAPVIHAKPSSVKLFATGDSAGPKLITSIPVNDPQSVAFSPAAHVLMINAAGGVRQWDISDPTSPTPQALISFGPGSNYTGSSFSLDGTRVAVGSNDGTVQLWRVDAGKLTGPPTTIRTPGADGQYVAVSPDGRVVAIPNARPSDLSADVGAGPRIELWDVTNPEVSTLDAVLKDQQVDGFAAGQLAYTRDGRALYTTQVSQFVTVWSTDPERDQIALCRIAGDPITPEQWAKYIPGEPFSSPCST